jgi:hypothetical protein
MSTRMFDWTIAIVFGMFLAYCAAYGLNPI